MWYTQDILRSQLLLLSFALPTAATEATAADVSKEEQALNLNDILSDVQHWLINDFNLITSVN